MFYQLSAGSIQPTAMAKQLNSFCGLEQDGSGQQTADG
jgi:hypothetical protein